MTVSHKNRVQMSVSGTPGTGTITLGSAASGHQSLAAAYGGNATIPEVTVYDGTAWETFENAAYTHSGTTLSRGTFKDSSTGSALSLTSAAIVDLGPAASFANRLEIAMQAVMPGGRLTLESGVPVSTTDQTAKTTIYYTPYVHNTIPLWDGARWAPVTFSETSEALGTITSGRPYDVFGFLSSGALDLEILSWTSDTARATAVTLQDGRYCKSGDKTRLLLGTFRTTATTTTEDSVTKRFVSNVYNRVPRRLFKAESTDNWSYSSGTTRQANANSANQVEVVASLADHTLALAMFCMGATASAAQYFSANIGEDSTTAYSSDAINYQAGGTASTLVPLAASLTKMPAVGYHYYAWLEKSGGAYATTFYSNNSGIRQGGLSGSILA